MAKESDREKLTRIEIIVYIILMILLSIVL